MIKGLVDVVLAMAAVGLIRAVATIWPVLRVLRNLQRRWLSWVREMSPSLSCPVRTAKPRSLTRVEGQQGSSLNPSSAHGCIFANLRTSTDLVRTIALRHSYVSLLPCLFRRINLEATMLLLGGLGQGSPPNSAGPAPPLSALGMSRIHC